MPSRSVQAMLYLALPAISWGGMFHVAQRVLPVVDPFWLTLLRLLPTVLVMLALLAVREPTVSASASFAGWKAALAGFLGFALFNFAVYSGITLTTPEHGAIVMSLTPLLGAILAWGATRRAPPRLTVLCIGLALLGAILVVTGAAGHADVPPLAPIGDGLVLVGALAWALYLRSSTWFPGWSSLRFSTCSTLAGTVWVALGVLGLSFAGQVRAPLWLSLEALAPELFYMIVLGTLLALLLWNRGIALLGPVNGALFMNLVPVSAFAIGLVRGHRPALVELLGALLVLVALLANNLLPRRFVPVAA